MVLCLLRDDGLVRGAVFRGLDVSIVGFDLFEVDDATDLAVMDLTPAARSRVRGGITADDADDAARILAALRDQRLPLCPSATGGKSAEDETTTTSPSRPTVPPSSGTAAGPTTTEPGGATASETTPAPSASTPSTSARTTSSSVPGVNCREAK